MMATGRATSSVSGLVSTECRPDDPEHLMLAKVPPMTVGSMAAHGRG